MPDESPHGATRLRIAATMHRGRNRHQQDAMWLAGEACQYADMPPREVHAGTDVLIAIADGVATSPTPARASLLTVQSLVERLQAQPEWSFDGLLGTRHVRAAQTALCDALASRRLAWGASTTLVAAHLRGNRLAIVNSGDSRAYLIRANGDTTQLSRDHTELQHLIDSGQAQAGIEYASVYHALSDCLIADPEAEDFAVHRETTELKPGDRLILCSDGVHDVLDETAWLVAMAAPSDPLKMVEVTRRAVLERGAPDNFSMLALAYGAQA